MNCRTCRENMTHVYDDFGEQYRVVFWCQCCGTICKIVQETHDITDRPPTTYEDWMKPRTKPKYNKRKRK